MAFGLVADFDFTKRPARRVTRRSNITPAAAANVYRLRFLDYSSSFLLSSRRSSKDSSSNGSISSCWPRSRPSRSSEFSIPTYSSSKRERGGLHLTVGAERLPLDTPSEEMSFSSSFSSSFNSPDDPSSSSVTVAFILFVVSFPFFLVVFV